MQYIPIYVTDGSQNRLSHIKTQLNHFKVKLIDLNICLCTYKCIYTYICMYMLLDVLEIQYGIYSHKIIPTAII